MMPANMYPTRVHKRYVARFTRRDGSTEKIYFAAQHDTHAQKIAQGIANKNKWTLQPYSVGIATL